MTNEALKRLKMRYADGKISKEEYQEMKEELKDEEEQVDDKPIPKKVSSESEVKHKSYIGAIIGVIMLITVIFVILYLLSSGILNSLFSGAISHSVGLTNPMVTVYGYAKTSIGTSPISVTFGSSTTSVNNGYYSVSLQNSQQYSIIIAYSSLVGTETCDAGILNLQSSSSNLYYNVSC